MRDARWSSPGAPKATAFRHDHSTTEAIAFDARLAQIRIARSFGIETSQDILDVAALKGLLDGTLNQRLCTTKETLVWLVEIGLREKR
jgi:hypothetical protein